MIHTAFTQQFGCAVPLQCAAMPGVSTPELIAAVADAGGMGMLPAPLMTPNELDTALDDVRKRTSGVFGVNFLIPFLNPGCVTVAAEKSKLVEFFYGEPDPAIIAHAHALGAHVSWQVGSLAEAVSAERAGCDLVVAQGTEAGGHVRGRTRLLPLLSQILKVLEIPVLAAGGIGTARDLAAVLAAGASGARVGTRFVATRESGAHPSYVQALIDASAQDTCLTEAFSVMWPNAPHRVLRSSVAAAEALHDEVVGEVPQGGRRVPVQRFSVICPTTQTTGHIEAMALYAGESVTAVRHIQPAAAVMAELVAGAEALLDM